MIWQGPSNNLQWKRTNAYNSQNVLLYGNIANPTTAMLGQVNVAANDLYLRIVRAGSTFTASFSLDGRIWTQAGAVTWPVAGVVEVGIATSYWIWFGTNTGPALGDYTFFDLEVPGATLVADRAGMPAAGGGSIGLLLNLGASHAGELHLVLGSLSGAVPGIPLPGGPVLPLNPDFLFDAMVSLQGAPGLFPGTFGTLNASGASTATVILPPALFAPFTGWSMRFAAIVAPPSLASFAVTNAVEVAIVQ